MAVIDLKEISRIYGFGDTSTLALDDVSLSIDKGEFVAIMGPSGSGKSTLMNVLGLLDTPSIGVYKLDGKDVSHVSQKKRAQLRREKIGFIFQSFNLLPRLSVIENVSMPLIYKGVSHVKRMRLAEKILTNVNLTERQYYMPNQLSGGQVQRVAVARALINKPSLLLADEPTGNLDTAASARIMALFKQIHEAGNTIIMVTHNPELAEYADRFIMMRDGKIELDTDTFSEALNVITHSKNRASMEHAENKKIEPKKIDTTEEIAAESGKSSEREKAETPVKKTLLSKRKDKKNKKKKKDKNVKKDAAK